MALVEEVGKLIDGADSSDKLQWIALGAYAAPGIAPTFRREDIKLPPVNQGSLMLLQKIDKKQVALGTHSGSDQYLTTLLWVGGLRERPAPEKATGAQEAKNKE